jgi:hypothetical protein
MTLVDGRSLIHLVGSQGDVVITAEIELSELVNYKVSRELVGTMGLPLLEKRHTDLSL